MTGNVLLQVCIVLLLQFSVVRGQCACAHRLPVLRALYASTDGASWAQPWDLNDPTAPCHLSDVTCNTAVGDITSLSLGGRGLRGYLPNALANLTGLTSIDVSRNFISGTLSATYAAWTSVTTVNVSANMLSGSLPPEYASWSSTIKQFYANGNALSGSLPLSYSNWTSLTTFYVHDNVLTGSLPAAYRSWTLLTNFAVHNNSIDGTLPHEFSSWTAIDTVEIQFNRIAGTLPPQFAAWGSLHRFVANNNQLNGSLPSDYEKWAVAIGEFDVQHNRLTGTLPPAYGSWRTVRYFNLFNNSLEGSLPPEYGNWSVDPGLNVHTNRISGTLPKEYQKWKGRISFDVHNNNITGTLPLEYAAWVGVVTFNVYGCRLTGTLPPEYEAWGKVSMLGIGNNSFVGSIPPSWGVGMTSIALLFASYSSFSGSIPPRLLQQPRLQFFAIAFSNISGALPSQFALPLFLLDVQNNTHLTASPLLQLFTGITVCGTDVCPSNKFLKQYCFPYGFVSDFVLSGLDGPGLLEAASRFLSDCDASSAPTPMPPPPSRQNTSTAAPPLLRAPSPLPSASQRSSAVMVYVALAVGGSVVSRGVVPSLQRASTALRLASMCKHAREGSDVGDAELFGDVADNPLSLSLPAVGPGDALRYASGVVLGNAILVLGISVALHGAALVRGCHPLLRMLPSSLLPGSVAITYGTLVQPSVSACAALLAAASRTTESVAYATGMLLLWLLFPTYCGWAVLCNGRRVGDGKFLLCTEPHPRSPRHRSLVLAATKKVRHRGPQQWALPSWGTLADRIRVVTSYGLDPAVHWVRRSPGTTRQAGSVSLCAHTSDFLLHNMEAVFGGYAEHREWYFLLDWGTAVLSAVILGVAEMLAVDGATASATCNATEWGSYCALVLAVLPVVCCLWLRPYSVRLEFAACVGIGSLGCLGAGLAVGGALDAADGVIATANVLSAVVMILLLAHSAAFRFELTRANEEHTASVMPEAPMVASHGVRAKSVSHTPKRHLHRVVTVSPNPSATKPPHLERDVGEQLRRLVVMACALQGNEHNGARDTFPIPRKCD